MIWIYYLFQASISIQQLFSKSLYQIFRICLASISDGYAQSSYFSIQHQFRTHFSATMTVKKYSATPKTHQQKYLTIAHLSLHTFEDSSRCKSQKKSLQMIVYIQTRELCINVKKMKTYILEKMDKKAIQPTCTSHSKHKHLSLIRLFSFLM